MREAKHIFFTILGITLALILPAATASFAEVPQKFNYQGYLTDAAGDPIDSSVSMTFYIYDVAGGGSALWSEGPLSVAVENGYYSVILGTTTPIELSVQQAYYLGVQVGSDAEMTPREELTSAMYAFFVKGLEAGESNTFVGLDAGGSNANGVENTFIGRDAGEQNDADWNTFIGFQAGWQNTTGRSNTFIGRHSGSNNNEGESNTFIGMNAGGGNLSGGSNTFIGSSAGNANSEGYSNTFVGSSSGYSNRTGSSNTFIGNSAGPRNNSGNDNTAIGYQAGFSNTAGSGNVFLGRRAGYDETGSNKLYIHNELTLPLIYGEFDYRLVRINGDLEYTGALTHVSDISFKQVDSSFTRGLEALEQLQPIAYHYKADTPLALPTDRAYVGLSAQEVQAVIPEAVETHEEGYLMLNNDPIVWTMLNAIKELKAENEALRQEMQAQEERFQTEIQELKDGLQ